MKNNIVWICFFLVIFLVKAVSAQKINEKLFSKANQLYESGEYEPALNIYMDIIKLGYASGELYYNLGNCHFKVKNYGYARYYYEKAIQLMPFDNSVAHNLELLLEILPGDPGYGMPPETSKLLYAMSFSSFQKYAFWMSIILLFFGAYLFNQYISTGNKNYSFRWITVTVTSVVILIFALWLNLKREVHFSVVVAENAYVKNEPNDTSPDLFVLQAGAKVYVLEEIPEYCKIRMPDGKIGWTASDSIKRL